MRGTGGAYTRVTRVLRNFLGRWLACPDSEATPGEF